MDGGTVNLGISEIVATSNVTISGGTWASCQLDICGPCTFSSVLTLNRVNIRIDGGTCTFNSNITCTSHFFVHALNGGYTSTCAIGAYTLTVNGYLYVGYGTLCGVITSTTGRLIANSVSYVGGSSGGIGTITPDAGSTLTFNGAVTIYSAGTLGSNTGYTLDINADLTVNSGGTLNLPNSSGAFYMSGSAWYMGGTVNHNNGTTTFDRSGTTDLYQIDSSSSGILLYNAYISAGTTVRRRSYGSISVMGLYIYNVITVAGVLSVSGAYGYVLLMASAPTIPVVLTGSGVWDDNVCYLPVTNQYIAGINYDGYGYGRTLYIACGTSGGSGVTKTLQGNVQCGGLLMGSYGSPTYTIDLNGYNVTAKSISFGTLSYENVTLYIRTGTFRIEGASTISRGTINGNTGIIQLLGAVTLNSPATINAPNSPGYIQFGGGLTINSGATFNKGTGDTIFSAGQNVTDNNAWAGKQDLGNVHITTTGIVNFYGVKMTILQGDAVGTAYFKANSMITSYIDGVAGFVVDGDAGVTLTKS
jgi:hypothetical protein